MPTHKILIVEDDASLRLGIRLLLERARYLVLETGSGLEALELAERHQPNLILLDLGLPDGDGLNVALELRRRPDTAWIPLAVLTGEAIYGSRAALLAKLSVGTIPKPVTAERLERDLSIMLKLGGRRGPRRFPRYPAQIPALCRLTGNGAGEAAFVRGMVRTVSEGGVMIELPDPVAKEKFLDLLFQLPVGQIAAAGKIVYSRYQSDETGDGCFGHGVQFVHIDPGELAAWRGLIMEKASIAR